MLHSLRAEPRHINKHQSCWHVIMIGRLGNSIMRMKAENMLHIYIYIYMKYKSTTITVLLHYIKYLLTYKIKKKSKIKSYERFYGKN